MSEFQFREEIAHAFESQDHTEVLFKCLLKNPLNTSEKKILNLVL